MVGGVEGGGEGGGENTGLDTACERVRQDQLCLRVAEKGGGIGEGIMMGIG